MKTVEISITAIMPDDYSESKLIKAVRDVIYFNDGEILFSNQKDVVKFVDGVRCTFESDQWRCDYRDYLSSGKPYGEEVFCNWCDDNKITPVG